MLEPFEKGRNNINEALNHPWILEIRDKTEKIQTYFPGDKQVLEMTKADFISYKTSDTEEKSSVKNFYFQKKISLVEPKSKNLLKNKHTIRKPKFFSSKMCKAVLIPL